MIKINETILVTDTHSSYTHVHAHTRGLFYQFLPFRYANRLQTSTFNSMAVCVYLMQAAFTAYKSIRTFTVSFPLECKCTRANAAWTWGTFSSFLFAVFFFELSIVLYSGTISDISNENPIRTFQCFRRPLNSLLLSQ